MLCHVSLRVDGVCWKRLPRLVNILYISFFFFLPVDFPPEEKRGDFGVLWPWEHTWSQKFFLFKKNSSIHQSVVIRNRTTPPFFFSCSLSPKEIFGSWLIPCGQRSVLSVARRQSSGVRLVNKKKKMLLVYFPLKFYRRETAGQMFRKNPPLYCL